MLLPDIFLHFKPNKENPHLSTSLFSMVLPFYKIQYFLFDKYLIFIMTIPIPSPEEFQLFKPHPIPIHLDFNTDVISSIYIKPQNSYLAISSNNQSYFTTNENFLDACYQNGFKTFCHSPRSISNIDNNPICETSMFINSQPYKCEIFTRFSDFANKVRLQSRFINSILPSPKTFEYNG